MLILYPATSLNLFVLIGFSCGAFKSFLSVRSCHYKQVILFLLLWFQCLLFLFLSWLLIRTSVIILLALLFWGTIELYCLRGKTVTFLLVMMLIFFHIKPLCWSTFLLHLFCWKFLFIKEFEFCQNYISESIEMIICFLSFILLHHSDRFSYTE